MFGGMSGREEVIFHNLLDCMTVEGVSFSNEKFKLLFIYLFQKVFVWAIIEHRKKFRMPSYSKNNNIRQYFAFSLVQRWERLEAKVLRDLESILEFLSSHVRDSTQTKITKSEKNGSFDFRGSRRSRSK